MIILYIVQIICGGLLSLLYGLEGKVGLSVVWGILTGTTVGTTVAHIFMKERS